MFGGWHVMFCGDVFQLPPVGGTRIYSTDITSIKKYSMNCGLKLTHMQN